MKLDRLKADLAKAKEKSSEWQARVKDIERPNRRTLKSCRWCAAWLPPRRSCAVFWKLLGRQRSRSRQIG